MAKRPDYQNLGDNLDEITDARNAVIRAWGKQVLADADAHLLHDVADGNQWSDWDQLQDEPDPEVVIEETETEPEPTQEVVEEVPEIETPSTPKTAKPPKAPKPATS